MNKQCAKCNKTFQITDQDLAFYKKIDVPMPTHCPDCRQQRRLAWRNERVFYERQCDLCQQHIISMYQANVSFPVYCQACWFSDQWDPKDYAQNYDFTKSFFQQFHGLQKLIPRVALVNNQGENSPYINFADRNKNCYLTTSCNDCEDCYYGFFMLGNKNCVDVSYAYHNEYCYELIDCSKCYQVRFAQNSTNCLDSWFLYDCSNCSNCFGCTNLRQKGYYIFNQAYSAEEYKMIVTKLTADATSLTEARAKFTELKKKAIYKYSKGSHNERVSGGGLEGCYNVKRCFEATELIDSAYCYNAVRTKNSYDVSFADGAELCYEAQSIIGYSSCFTLFCRQCPDSWYSDSCHNSHDLFGCIGLRKQQFCILNKQYSVKEYFAIREKIIQQMTKDQEFGEYFSIAQSFFAYNESLANTFYPLKSEEVKQHGWRWQEPFDNVKRSESDSQQQVCEKCNRSYRFIQQELKFYESLSVPLPKQCFYCRLSARETQRNPWQLFQRQCMCTQIDHKHQGRCAETFETNYAPDNTAIIYCEECYNKEIY
ncbi:MAG: hypothetical protein WC801_02925 [Patescibacteria group bacterium]